MAKRRKQKALPGMEPESIAEIDAAAELYEELRDKRQRATDKEVNAKEQLIEVMRKYKLEVYKDHSQDPPIVVSLKEAERTFTVKVERVAAPDPTEDALEDEESDEDAAQALA